MSWKGFKRGLNELMYPRYLQNLSPEEREARRQHRWRNSELFFFFQAAEKTEKKEEDDAIS